MLQGHRVSLCSPGCPGTHFVDQAGLKLRNPPASASRVLGSKACATTHGQVLLLCIFLNPCRTLQHATQQINSICHAGKLEQSSCKGQDTQFSAVSFAFVFFFCFVLFFVFLFLKKKPRSHVCDTIYMYGDIANTSITDVKC